MSNLSHPSKTALVTGGSEGLGLHVSRALSEAGYAVTIVGRDTQKLDSVLKHLTGPLNRSLPLDLSTRAGTEELVRIVERESFRVLVNNAGASQFGALTTLSEDTAERTLQLNLVAPALISRAFLRTAAPGSVLVNVTSIMGTIPLPGNTLYCAAKAGMQVLTECLWYEARQKKVRVMDFRPVSLRTNFHRSAGGNSVAGGMAAAPEAAARDLVVAIEGTREFVYIYSIYGMTLECLRRILPKRVIIRLMGQKAEKAGYL
jgi:short-subunit dehydrogenase